MVASHNGWLFFGSPTPATHFPQLRRGEVSTSQRQLAYAMATLLHHHDGTRC
jgi:hypothetical protein